MDSTVLENVESRNALVFRMPEQDENAPQKGEVEEDDSFYELTFEEFRAIYNETQKQKAINDKLLPRSKREEEEAKLKPPKFDYKYTVIRIEFLDRMVLQGRFRIEETVGDLKEFVRDHVKEPGVEFDLFTSPPKAVLSENDRLVDLKLVPSAKVYISFRNGGSCELVLERAAVVPFECAQEAARNVRRPVKNDSSKPTPGPSRSDVEPIQQSSAASTTRKVPKWFKMK